MPGTVLGTMKKKIYISGQKSPLWNLYWCWDVGVIKMLGDMYYIVFFIYIYIYTYIYIGNW